MKKTEKKYQCVPFWSWNDELEEDKLLKQMEWMNENGIGGFFMHARGGLTTEYLSEKWFNCITACAKKAKELGMEAYAYDENGWPSGFVGGKLLEDIENHDRTVFYRIGAYDENALVSYDMSGDRLKRIQGDDKKLCENCLNVYEEYSTSTADILNPEVVEKFLDMTHEEYKKRDVYGLKGFFTDEPQYFRWGTPYTKMLAPYFKDAYAEDILDGLGLLFVEKEGYRAFRYKYWKALQSLMLENFAKKVYDWCDNNGYKLTGHYIEEGSLAAQMWCCAGIMPFYEYEHIPGIDYLGRVICGELPAKQVSSVAAQLGKKQVLTETYGCCGWDITPQELKEVAECQFVSGVNLMCPHLLPYSERGQRKRDYPAHYSIVNPWVRKNYKEFNDYFSVLGQILAESEEMVNVGVLHPIRSAYFDYKRFPEVEGYGVSAIEIPFFTLTEELTTRQIPHHYIDETILSKYGTVEGSRLRVGKCAYDFLIVPKIYTMDVTTEKLLRAYVEAGGKVFLWDGKPTYLEGEKYDYTYLENNTTWEEIIASQPYCVLEKSTVRATIRKDEKGNVFIYAVNLGPATTVDFILPQGTSFSSYDILKDEYSTISKNVVFEKGQSYILYISNKQPQAKKPLKPLKLGEKFTVCKAPSNYLTLDFLRYSTDGETYSEPLHHMGVFNELLKRRYAGELYLKYTFTVEKLPNVCKLLAEDMHTISVTVNGKIVESCGVSQIEHTLLEYDVAKCLTAGENEIIIRMNYYQSEQVYYVLFGENVTEGLKNCLAYDTDIEAVYLKGDFGVFGDFEQGNCVDILLGDNFRIAKQKQEISCLIKDGFPFFSGDINLKQTVSLDDTDYELVIDSRFHLLDVKINGKEAGRMMFGNRLDISDLLHKGNNEIELVLTVGNRNLLGPFHTLEQENAFVGPFTFEREGTWQDGKSSILRNSYSFVKTII